MIEDAFVLVGGAIDFELPGAGAGQFDVVQRDRPRRHRDRAAGQTAEVDAVAVIGMRGDVAQAAGASVVAVVHRPQDGTVRPRRWEVLRRNRLPARPAADRRGMGRHRRVRETRVAGERQQERERQRLHARQGWSQSLVVDGFARHGRVLAGLR
jgi:hypothetical protein